MWEIVFQNKKTVFWFFEIGVKDTDGLAEIFQVPLNGSKAVP